MGFGKQIAGGRDSKTADGVWGTPIAFFRALDQEFNFELDACAIRPLAKCRRFFSPKRDGLKQRWQGTIWCNPPYGRGIGDWLKKAYESARAGDATVACLVFTRTDTAWWRDYVMKASEVRFVAGRLTFEKPGATSNSPMPNVLVIFKAGRVGRKPRFSVYNWRKH